MRKKFCFMPSQKIDAERREEKAKAIRTLKAIERSRANTAARRRLAELYDIRYKEFCEITGFRYSPDNLLKRILKGSETVLRQMDLYFTTRIDRTEQIPLDLPDLPGGR